MRARQLDNRATTQCPFLVPNVCFVFRIGVLGVGWVAERVGRGLMRVAGVALTESNGRLADRKGRRPTLARRRKRYGERGGEGDWNHQDQGQRCGIELSLNGDCGQRVNRRLLTASPSTAFPLPPSYTRTHATHAG